MVNRVKPVAVEITHDDKAKIVSGKAKEEIGHLPGLVGTGRGRMGWMGASEAGSHKQIEWVLRAEPGAKVKITATSERAGTDDAHITLE